MTHSIRRAIIWHMEPKELIMLIGLPRSGKSTWARKHGAPIVNPDSIRLAIHGQPFVASAEPLVWAVAEAMVSALFIAGHAKVILDATNVTRKRRAAWLKGGKGYDEVWGKTFATPKQVCIARAESTPSLIPVIESMAEDFEPWDPDGECLAKGVVGRVLPTAICA